ncbi:MAG: efflux RND transporter periplasmic adaptor subunit [Bacteroidales bacterium]|nr:efflux RND transporter periplasmic adaptor subunit [Bacteroidales bacterium]
MALKKKTKIWIIIAAVVVVFIIIMSLLSHKKMTLVVDSDPCQTGNIENTVTATGEIQPVYKVEVGTQVSGIVEKMYVDYNSQVKKGQLLAELDKSLLLEQVKQAQATLSTSTSNKQLAQKSFDRVKALYEQKAATQEEYDQAEANLEQAKNQYITAQSDYGRARTNLKYAEIYSPIDGVILSKAVEEGQTVASSFNTPTLFTIAKNLTDMQLEANVDEADIGQVKTGQKVTFTVDAFPGETFEGSVRQIRLVPTVTSNVVNYTVIIDAPNNDGKLYPGMTANITILVQEEEGLVIPLEATQYNIDGMTMEMLRKQGYTVEGKADAADGVWVVNGKTIKRCGLTLGINDGANVIVTSGLKEGDRVVRNVSLKEEGKEDGPSVRMGPPERKKRE